jgi:hypothetical protein
MRSSPKARRPKADAVDVQAQNDDRARTRPFRIARAM